MILRQTPLILSCLCTLMTSLVYGKVALPKTSLEEATRIEINVSLKEEKSIFRISRELASTRVVVKLPHKQSRGINLQKNDFSVLQKMFSTHDKRSCSEKIYVTVVYPKKPPHYYSLCYHGIDGAKHKSSRMLRHLALLSESRSGF